METRRDVFQAIADPTRRAILGLLATQSLTLNALAENFEVSRPAISKHVKILSECGLIEIDPNGRERYCRARMDKLSEVSDWVNQYSKFWESQLDALDLYLQQLQNREHKTEPKNKNHGKTI
ncbi:MAG: metalloregulator ArsR/SmtB family transcription factor [Flavobacteriales bacterium]|nr:metalloregulator ArsR/SmtB family transcription factor [Flavobacteriales bacterium]